MNIIGKVINEAGAPIAGAKVDIFVGGTAIAGVTSGSTGGFEFSNETPCAGQELKFVATKQEYQPLTEVTHPDREEVTVELKLNKLKKPVCALHVTGKVIDQNGQPLAGASVAIFGDESELAVVTSEADGGFQFSHDSLNDVHALKLVVTQNGFKKLSRTVSAAGETDLELQLKEERHPRPMPWLYVLLTSGGLLVIYLIFFHNWGGAEPANNGATDVRDRPDLVIVSVKPNPKTEGKDNVVEIKRDTLIIKRDTQISFDIIVSNQGKAGVPASVPVTVSAFVRTDNDRRLRGKNAVISDGLKAGERRNTTLYLTLPKVASELIFVVDPVKAVEESDEKNNESRMSVLVR